MFTTQNTIDLSGSDDSANSPTLTDEAGNNITSSRSTIDRVLGHPVTTPNVNMKLPLLPPSPPMKHKSKMSRYRIWLFNY